MTDIQAQWATTCERCGSSKFSADGMLSYSCPVCIPIDPASLPSPAPDSPLEALSWLGDTVEEIAEGLKARGIKGKLRVAKSCPLSNYLQLWWGPETSVACGFSFVTHNGEYMSYENPSAVEAFERTFDAGGFPDLIDNG